MDKVRVKHKELLTFSNLTNLEWEFVKLKQENNMELDSEEPEYYKLEDLLTPEQFAKTNEEGEVEQYCYIEEVKKREELTNEDIENGLVQMRSQAGVAMEYKEKMEAGNAEGDFLGDWEVIYGADKYKIMKEYIDQRWEPIKKILEKEGQKVPNEPPYASRDDLKEKHEAKLGLKALTKKVGISVAADMISSSVPGGRVTILEELGAKVKAKLEKAVKKIF
ncbi:hypothetical protein [Halanaerobacter jeridensis]|uniref:Uncharacterized protein n=1 Tax=Halanaerobacter jeridensis TaxID=706427 RepID=A0A939BRM2_9FIRM|nr:hypothetical protein [Halanaerobacter jeridensis]MBM7557484.1 hypothetical protein [Halanaerobacter jeridensis]